MTIPLIRGPDPEPSPGNPGCFWSMHNQTPHGCIHCDGPEVIFYILRLGHNYPFVAVAIGLSGLAGTGIGISGHRRRPESSAPPAGTGRRRKPPDVPA